jgi:hypothetical protein
MSRREVDAAGIAIVQQSDPLTMRYGKHGLGREPRRECRHSFSIANRNFRLVESANRRVHRRSKLAKKDVRFTFVGSRPKDASVVVLRLERR